MNFASKYVYAGVQEAEVDDDMLDEAANTGVSAIADEKERVALKAKKASSPSAAGSAAGGGFFSSLFSRKAAPSGPGAAASDAKAGAIPAAPAFSASILSPSLAASKPVSAVALENARKKMQLHGAVKQRVDTNVVSVQFATLSQNADDVFAGDPVFCRHCKAVFNNLSVLLDGDKAKAALEKKDDKKEEKKEDKKDDKPAAPGGPTVVEKKEEKKEEKKDDFVLKEGQKLWVCEFCRTNNAVDIEAEEVPKQASRDYVVEPAKEAKKGDVKDSENENFVIFCIAAVDRQLEQLQKQFPKKKVALITFNNEVTIVGDGTTEPVVVTGDKLKDQAMLMAEGKKYELKASIGDSRKQLGERLFNLEEQGQTALGPAMVVGIALASNKKGSQVILCTDGLANVGLGAMDKNAKEEELKNIANWYEGVGNWAKLMGVTTSIISITGDECSLENLGKVAVATGGDVDRVDPLELTKNFSTILANPVIATQVKLTFILHQGLAFRNEDTVESRLVRDVGNVTKDTEQLLEFGVRSKEEMAKYGDLKSLPFQVQIEFTALNGMRAVRVITHAQPVTTAQEVAEKDVRVDVLSANVSQQSARMAAKGDYMNARVNHVAYSGLLNRVAKTKEQKSAYSAWASEIDGFDRSVAAQQMTEAILEEDESSLSRSESKASSAGAGAGAGAPAPAAPPMGSAAPAASMSKPFAAKKKAKVSDETYKMFHKFQAKSSAAYSKHS